MNIRDEQKETILGMVNTILELGEFDEPNEQIQEGEAVIGEMTPYEKALYASLFRSADKHNELVAKVIAGEVDKKDLRLTGRTTETLKDLFWTSIKHRLGRLATEANGVGVRNNWKIVALSQPAETEHDESLFKAFMDGALAGIIPLDMKHDCEGCEHYDKCDLPIKRPRG